jgi:hypothetical protein
MKTTKTFLLKASTSLLMFAGFFNSNFSSAQTGGATFQVGPTMMRGKIFPTTTLLDNGKVISFSGRETNFVSCSFSDLYDPAANSFTETAMNFPHDASATVKLTDGSYMLFGGGENLGVAPGYATSEMYLQSTGTFVSKASMTMQRMQHAGVQLLNGKVLIAGAWYNNNGAQYGEVYDVTADTYTATGAMVVPRAQPNIFPTADGGAIISSGWPSYGGAVIPNVEYYSPITNSFTLQSNQLIPTDSGWAPVSIYTRPFDDCKMTNGKYLMMASRNITGPEFALIEFDPNTKLFSKINTLSPLVDSLTDGGFADFVLNKADNMVYLIGFDAGFDPQRVCVVTVDLSTGNVYHPTTTYTLPAQEYFYATYTYMPSSGKILVMGVNGSNTSYFTGTDKTYILTPQITLGVKESSVQSHEMTCYPNPAANEIKLNFNSNETTLYNLEFIDITGRVIQQETKWSNNGLQTWNLNTSNLPNGMYLLSVQSAKGRQTKSVIIDR